MIVQTRNARVPARRLASRKRKRCMNEQPQTWHYGLVARWWAEFNAPDPDELAFYPQRRRARWATGPRSGLRRRSPPASLVERRSGRRWLRHLARHARAIAGRGRTSRDLRRGLYQQAMHDLDLPRSYRTIYICDSFGLGGRRDQDAAALRRCYDQLVPGGTLVFSHYLPNDDPERWSYWLPEQRQQLPEAWPEAGNAQASGQRRRDRAPRREWSTSTRWSSD